jgi:ATP-dependent RNA helicase DeaD
MNGPSVPRPAVAVHTRPPVRRGRRWLSTRRGMGGRTPARAHERAAGARVGARSLYTYRMNEDTAAPTGFDALDLPAPLLRVLGELGYETPSPIQAQTIPHLLAGRDLLGQAQTGTGKTAAFALPILARLDLSARRLQALVLTPTRELGIQVAEALQKYATHLPGFRVLPIYGGQSYGPQLAALSRGVHVVVGTPGRIIDHLERGSLDLSTLRHVVLDEADEMLRMGFIDDVETILRRTPAERQTALFSATLPAPIRRIAQVHLRKPIEVTIAARTRTAEGINQRYWVVGGLHKLDALTRILEAEPFDAMIVFVRTRQATEELAERLQARGFSAAALHGDIPQAQRERTIAALKENKIDILVATDVAARGLDVDRVSHVVNYDVPTDPESYVHRIGRTGRAGRSGEALLFVAPRERGLLRAIEHATRQRIAPMELPTVQMVNDVRVARFKQKIVDTLAAGGLEEFQAVIEALETEQNIPALEIAAALAKLAHGGERFLLLPQSREPRTLDEGADERPERPRRERQQRTPEPGMATYRVEVGHVDGLRPGHLVGALTHQAPLTGKQIGRIEILDDHTLIDLTDELAPELLQQLKTVWCAGQQLRITRDGEPPDNSERRPPRPQQRRFTGGKHPLRRLKPTTARPKH